GGFFADLKRRRVIRVLLLYAVAGWIVIEVASVVLPALNLPPWSVTLVIVLVALGFPIAIAMGWMFDIGPGGVARTDAGPVSVPSPAPAPSTQAPSLADPGPPPGRPAASAPPVPPEGQSGDRRTIAVLPFVNMSD